MKKAVKVLIFIPVIIIILVVSMFFISPIVNNRVLHNFTNQLKQIELPPDTNIVEIQSICGKLNGNGNGMDFLGCAIIESESDITELEHYFSSINYKPAKSSSEQRVLFEMKPVANDRLDSVYLEHGKLYFESIKDKTDFSNLYYIVIFDGGYDSGFDIRGH